MLTNEHGVAGIDPHKKSATIAVLDRRGGVVGSESFPISEEGIDRLLTFLLGTELTIDRAMRAERRIPQPILGYVVAAIVVLDGLATIVLLLRADAG